MTQSLRILAKQLGGEVHGHEVLCPGPGHSAGDRSLAVRFNGDGFVSNSFAGDDWKQCRDHIARLLGDTAIHVPKPQYRPRKDHRELAIQIWQEARPTSGTPVEQYLDSRNLSARSDALRFHPECPFKGERAPAMLAAMVDIATNRMSGVHRTKLSPKDKAMLGPARGACVKLSGDDEVCHGLHIAEGIETALALLAVGFSPIWATLSANGLAHFPVLEGVQSLTVFADNDESGTGERAARECALRWRNSGREACVYMAAEIGSDFAEITA